ncbi:ParB/RepB/Spo0J family partition protein [Alistipes indistinctus]|uniref:ParB/RepB/Spo0J family partition protein n=3 Tax=Alistipes indistinctus TaxID=626932 RepID=UPI00241CAF20|nr:ParB N-terminal domain-containing protein [Alistipes indistinctus]
MDIYDWLSKRTPRSVDELRPWPENPRLNPEETHVTTSDYVEDIISEKADRENFCDLVKSIAERGFIPADPIVVWQNPDNKKFYVAEGNRRILALKILRDPDKAPRSIRAIVRKYSALIDLASIKKVQVSVAPSFDSAEWYINQRNNTSSLQRPWSRVQQQRWIASLYEKYEGNIDQILSITNLDKSEIEGYIRILKLKDFINIPEIKNELSPNEYARANSYKFPITILERFFNYAEVKERWGIEYDGIEIRIKSNKKSFYKAYVALIKRIVNEGEDQINTRFKSDDVATILDSLPVVSFDPPFSEDETRNILPTEKDTPKSELRPNPTPNQNLQPQKNDPNRNRVVLNIYKLNTGNAKLLALFNELKEIPFRYKNSIAATIRVFLDVAVLNYIQTEGLEDSIKTYYRCELRDVILKKRLEFIKANHLSGKSQVIVSKLLNPENEYSLDVLNGYIHSNDTHYSGKQFLNGFWDFLFPLFEKILEINEE